MRSLILGLLMALALPVLAAADCCCCCEDEADSWTEGEAAVSKATSPALPKPEDMQSFDGSTAPHAVNLPATRLAVFKGTLANPMAVWEGIVPLAAAQGILNDAAKAWSIV